VVFAVATRHPKPLTLTEAGRCYVANIRCAFELVAETIEKLRKAAAL
jgi:DNA-binding transcriptional LysR family regulator